MRQVVSFVSTLYSVSRPNEYARFSTVANWRNIYRFRADKAGTVVEVHPRVGLIRVRFRVRVTPAGELLRQRRQS